MTEEQTSPGANDRYRLFIGNIGYRVSETELRGVMEQFGEVMELRLVKDPVTGFSSGYAFAEMMHADEAHRAVLGLNGKRVDGHFLIARPLF